MKCTPACLIVLTAVAAFGLAPAATHAAMVTNDNILSPSFEQTDEDGINGQDWQVTTNSGSGVNVSNDTTYKNIIDDGADGDRFATFFGTMNTGNGSPSNGAQIDQNGIAIDPAGIGQEHTLSFSVAWLRGAPRTSDNAAISAWVFDGDDSSELATTRYVHGTPSTSTGDNNWERTSLTFTPTSSTIDLRFQETTPNSGASDAMLDHITLTYVPIPEPAAVGLVVIGGVILLTRRQRAGRL